MNPYEVLDLRQSAITGSDLAKMPVEVAAKVVALKREVQNLTVEQYNEWLPFGLAPLDGTQIEVHGYWHDDIKTPFRAFIEWSSIMSDGVSGYQWYVSNSLTPLKAINVILTHYRLMSDAPKF